jgi:gp16 family phage-associated protein
MLVVETIAKVRRDFHRHGKSIKEIARERGLSRNTVRKVLRSDATEFSYARDDQPYPQLGPYLGELDRLLAENEARSRRERLTLTRIHEALQGAGYAGSYDSVRRYARRWRTARARSAPGAYVPLTFAPGEAYQFDWSQEYVLLGGVTTKVHAAHLRLCHSRMPWVQCYPRESQEMVFDAHVRGFRFLGGACERGIYDNMRTAVDTVFVGKARTFNRRFQQMCSHYLVEPTACTPAAGWEKGQVENQVGLARKRFFSPRPRFANLAELNAWLVEQCRAYAQASRHPEFKDKTIWEVLEAERPRLITLGDDFDGYREAQAPVSRTCLITFDRNRYSVDARAANRPVQIRGYADRVVVRLDGELVADHPRAFGRDHVVYDPWHYLPVLARKPGALRNGAPFKNWDLPEGLRRLRKRLAGKTDGDRQFVSVLAAVPQDGIEAVDAACREALGAGLASADAVLNILSRRHRVDVAPIETPSTLNLTQAPVADCARYDALREVAHGAR